jgi:ubiquitin-protein ligase
METREQRLHRDRTHIEQLVQLNPELVACQIKSGDPPDRYEVTFFVTGLRRVPDLDDPVQTRQHRFELAMDGSYPRTPYHVQWKTPIFHPNINGAAVCHSGQYGGEIDIARWIRMLFDFVRGASYRPDHRFNPEAADWYGAHPNVFPVDRRKLSVPDLS